MRVLAAVLIGFFTSAACWVLVLFASQGLGALLLLPGFPASVAAGVTVGVLYARKTARRPAGPNLNVREPDRMA